MARVVALGGVFVRSSDPSALAAWYSDNLGLEFDADGAMVVLPDVGGAYAVFAFFPTSSDYIGDPASQGAMVNLRVDDLDGVTARLAGRGVAFEGVEDSEYGRFAWVTDPEGRRVELWEAR
ncbi:MAG TPA: VOC family protein [Acidimicrobiales bacterium]|nr:VOC family protein [Acidimicrobiales bacterium]